MFCPFVYSSSDLVRLSNIEYLCLISICLEGGLEGFTAMRRSGVNQPKVKRLVGKYEIGRTIGEGTFAKVKIAKNSENGEHVAIKILDKEKVLKHKMAEQVLLYCSKLLCFFS